MLFRSDRKSTRLNSSHTLISYAVFCLKKKNTRELATSTGGKCPPAQANHDMLCTHAPARSLSTSIGGRFPRVQSTPDLLFFFLMIRRPPRSTLFPYPTLLR